MSEQAHAASNSPQRRALTVQEAWDAVREGHAQILDLRTRVERRRYGWPPGAKRASLLWHSLFPRRPGVIYLCQHAVRSKVPAARGAPEVKGGFVEWEKAGLPIEGGRAERRQ